MDRILLESARGFPTSPVEALAPLPESLSLVKRYDGGLRVCDLRGCEGVADFSVFDEVVDQLGRVSAPARLSVWVLPAEAFAAWDRAHSWVQVTRVLYRLITTHQESPPAGEALVIVGAEAPDPATVFILKSLGLAVYDCRPDAPLPVLAVHLPPGDLLVAMVGDGL